MCACVAVLLAPALQPAVVVGPGISARTNPAVPGFLTGQVLGAVAGVAAIRYLRLDDHV